MPGLQRRKQKVLTAAECKVAAKQARTYPVGNGFKYFALDLSIDTLAAMGLPHPPPVSYSAMGSISVAEWLAENRPEFVKKYG
jgi:hypothetical protein